MYKSLDVALTTESQIMRTLQAPCVPQVTTMRVALLLLLSESESGNSITSLF